MYDSSDQRIDNLFNQWTSNAGKLYPEAVRFRLQDEFGLVLNSAMFAEALARINGNGSTTSAGDEEEMTRDVFKSLWQRLMLGAVCTRRLLSDDEVGTEVDDCQLIEYSEQDMDMLWMTEQQLLFKSPLRIPGRSRVTRRRGYARWVRSSAQSADRLLRLGVKFFLHPIAVSEAVMAARVGMTRIDRYNHQYFVSLEVYAMKHDYASEAPNVDGSVGLVGVEPLEVGPTIVRSVMFLVATGNPDDMHRNWLLSVINNRTQGTDDPLDFFRSDSAAANQVLDGVCLDLESNGRMREYQADFLLYTIIDGAAKEMTPICIAYGHRLRWLQDQLHSKKLALPAQYINEVSSVRLEMQELRQWLGQLKGILKTLSADCKSITQRGNAMPWNFGAHAEGRGKSLLLFLSSTDAHLEQTKDRLNTLDELARSFLEHHQRHREAFNNNILLTLTVATAVFMPAQLLAGIYGTNFVDEDGNPGIPELRWKYGYHYFLLSSVSVIAVGLLLAFVCLRGRG